MHKNDKKLFSYNKSPETPDDLFDKVILSIKKEEHRIAILKRRLAIFSLGIIGSVVAFIPAVRMVQAGFSESGFSHFFSLLFSDFGIIATYWQNFMISLLETLPIIHLAILLAITFVFLGSLKFLARDLKFIFRAKQLTHNI